MVSVASSFVPVVDSAESLVVAPWVPVPGPPVLGVASSSSSLVVVDGAVVGPMPSSSSSDPAGDVHAVSSNEAPMIRPKLPPYMRAV